MFDIMNLFLISLFDFSYVKYEKYAKKYLFQSMNMK